MLGNSATSQILVFLFTGLVWMFIIGRMVMISLRYTQILGISPKMGVTPNGWFTTENSIKMDDLGGTPILGNP